VSPDGRLLATAGHDGNVRLWNVASGREVGLLTKDRIELCCAAFSPDGKALATGDKATLRVWDIARRRVIWEQKQARGQNYLAFAADGKSLTTAGPDCGVRRWDPTTGKPLQERAPTPIQGLYDAVPLRDGNATITATFVCEGPRQGDAQLTWELRDSTTGISLRRIGTIGGPGHTVYSAAGHHGQLIDLSSDETTLAAVCDYRGRTVALYNVTTGKEERRLNIQSDELQISCVAFAPGGTVIAAGDNDGNLHLWDRKTGQELHTIPAHSEAIQTMIFLPGGDKLATVADDGVIRLWNPGSGKEVRPHGGCGSPIRTLAVTPDGKTVFTGSDEPFVQRWDSTSGKELDRFNGVVGGAYCISCSPDGKTLAAVDHNHDIVLWNVASGKETRRWKTGPDHNATQVAFAPDGNTLAWGGLDVKADGHVRFWDPVTGKEVGRTMTGHLGEIERLTFSADGKLIASKKNYEMRVWETATGQERLVIIASKPVRALSLAPDGARLAAACENGQVLIFPTVPDGSMPISPISVLGDGKSRVTEVATAKEQLQLDGPGHQNSAVAFSPDGRLLATGGDDGLVHLWETATWRDRGALRGHKGEVTALTFLPGGRLFSASADTTVLVWDVTTAP
jgi:WD40 repeat protein